MCSAKAAGFADRFKAAAAQLDLGSVALVKVTVDGDQGQLVMQYWQAGQTQLLTEALNMSVEGMSWRICN